MSEESTLRKTGLTQETQNVLTEREIKLLHEQLETMQKEINSLKADRDKRPALGSYGLRGRSCRHGTMDIQPACWKDTSMKQQLLRWGLVGGLLGLAGGWLASSLTGLGGDLAEALYDQANPVVISRAAVLYKTSQEWKVLMTSHKYRECRLLETQAFDIAQGPSREVRRLTFERDDRVAPAQMPVGASVPRLTASARRLRASSC